VTIDPLWLRDAVLGVVAVVALYCGAHLAHAVATRRLRGRDVDATHVAMAAAMAGMLLGLRDTGWTTVWTVVFLATTVWFAGRAVSEHRSPTDAGPPRRTSLSHLLASVVMLYMVLVGWWGATSSGVLGTHGAAAGGMAMTSAGAPLAGAVLAALLVVDATVSAAPLILARSPQMTVRSAATATAVTPGAGQVARHSPGPAASTARGPAVCLVLMSVAMAAMFVVR